MEVVKLILGILTAVGIIACIVLRIMKKHKDGAYIVELISLVLLVVIAILPVASGIQWKAESVANLFILITLCAYLVYRVFFRNN